MWVASSPRLTRQKQTWSSVVRFLCPSHILGRRCRRRHHHPPPHSHLCHTLPGQASNASLKVFGVNYSQRGQANTARPTVDKNMLSISCVATPLGRSSSRSARHPYHTPNDFILLLQPHSHEPDKNIAALVNGACCLQWAESLQVRRRCSTPTCSLAHSCQHLLPD